VRGVHLLSINVKAGFTLFEVMLALSIGAILTVQAVPLFNTFIRDYRVTSSANEMYEFLTRARTESIKRNVNVYVSFSTGDSWCAGMNISSACDCNTAGSCNLSVMKFTAAQQATMSTSGYASSAFYYSGAHGMASVAGTITFTRYGSTELVRLTAGRMGGVKMCSTGIGGYSACS